MFAKFPPPSAIFITRSSVFFESNISNFAISLFSYFSSSISNFATSSVLLITIFNELTGFDILFASSHTAFSVYFNDSASAVLLQEIINLLLSSNDINSDVLSTVLKIYNSVDGVEQSLVSIQTYLQSCDIRLSNIYWQLDSLLKKVDTLIAEEEESNSWLEKIFNWLQDSPEQEKQEATTQGNQSTSDATTAITDNSQGFIDSLGGLASSMSYSGTDCVWTFPAITLPAIPGVMDSMQLTTEKPIDFSYWVNQIPANLLLLIQSLLTVALIIYCFKEVYGTISYVLTLRGGGNNE